MSDINLDALYTEIREVQADVSELSSKLDRVLRELTKQHRTLEDIERRVRSIS